MDYLYEKMTAESFQDLCQSLLIPSYPDLQCFPVGQPDGGRDAASRLGDGEGLTIGQVKFKREDTAENAEWMIEALEGELPKVERLKRERGAKQYLMMTNARGTAHLDSGKIDIVQKWLDEHFPIPSQVLWRNDLNARLDGSNDLRLANPSILTGAATIPLIIEAMLTPKRKQLASVLKTFLEAQYQKDEEVKFKEVDLANSLLTLFVDVPSNISPLISVHSRDSRIDAAGQRALRGLYVRAKSGSKGLVVPDEDSGLSLVGTADLLLDGDVQKSVPWIILQGAPGQGKSTLAQYVCQVHRGRYLEKSRFISELPTAHTAAAFRLPFKVDLRDLASFLDGQSFLRHEAEANESARTFERFLSHLVAIQAGGASFTVDDLRMVLEDTPALIFLDGLDEVADLGLRRKLVDEIAAGLGRLKSIDADLQVVLTSRPSQLGGAPVFSKEFVRISLASIGPKIVRDYTEKWTAAKHLDADRAADVAMIMKEKLALPHIRELAKNPMQVTILLSLVLTTGRSLPDRRTVLYQKYVDLFMTREAEKDAVVRAHSALLLSVVEYVAWMLQSGAEADRTSGSVSAADLRQMVSDFLHAGHFDTSILADIFDQGLERVYVLVERVEGLYEFEVQPLREFFAARYLYSTAPVANFRSEMVHGDRAQRFEAIASNPYWANVTRFYAGFYHGGEIGALETSLRELVSSKDLAASTNARAIGALLLADRIFAAKRVIQNAVVDIVFDPLGVSQVASSRWNEGEPFVLPEAAGQARLAEIIIRDHIFASNVGASFETCILLSRNGGPSQRQVFIPWLLEVSGVERTDRIRTAILSGALDEVTHKELELLIEDDDPAEWELHARLQRLLLNAAVSKRMSEKIAGQALNALLAWGGSPTVRPATDLAWLSVALSANTMTPVERPESETVQVLADLPHRHYKELRLALSESKSPRHPRTLWDKPELWISHTEAIRDHFGETWALFRLVLQGVGRVAAEAPLLDEPGIEDSLYFEAWAARKRKVAASRWLRRMTIGSALRRLFWVGMLLSWAPSGQVKTHLAYLEEYLSSLDEADYWRLISAVESTQWIREQRGGRQRAVIESPAGGSVRLGYALQAAFGWDPTDFHPQGWESMPLEVRYSIQHYAGQAVADAFPGWSKITGEDRRIWDGRFRQLRKDGIELFQIASPTLYRGIAIPTDYAKLILRAPTEYPLDLVGFALDRLQRRYRPKHVRSISEFEKWSFE